MIIMIALAITLTGALCVLAYRLATYALPVMIAIEAARLAHGTGAGLIGAGLIGLLAGAASFGLLVVLFATLRAPILRIAVALIFAAPAAVAGYALMHGGTGEAVSSPVWRQIFCIAGGAFTGVSALARLVATPLEPN